MPDFNPWAPTIELGGDVGAGASAAGVGATGTGTAGGRFSIGRVSTVASPDDNHWAAFLLLTALVVLWALWQSKFRFSMTVG